MYDMIKVVSQNTGAKIDFLTNSSNWDNYIALGKKDKMRAIPPDIHKNKSQINQSFKCKSKTRIYNKRI